MLDLMILEKLSAWIEENVAPSIDFLLKPDNKYMDAATYEKEYITPAVYPLYIPPKTHRGEDSKVPAIIVQLGKMEEDMLKNEERIPIQLGLVIWNPGTYGEEETDGEKAQTFARNYDGWKDILLMIDVIKRKLQSAVYIEGFKLDKATKMEYGMVNTDEEITRYPYWGGFLTFTLTLGEAARVNTAFDDYL